MPRIASIMEVEIEWNACARAGVTCLYYGDAGYPALLAQLPDPPPLLYTLGNAALLHTPSVAIVGARNAASNSMRFAHLIAQELGQAGEVVVSGLARGIDTAAHQGSLATGTVAVVAGGVDVIYPLQNTALYHAIKEQGVIVATERLQTPVSNRLFPRRNRVIAGLARATVVVEAAHRSGSLITARLANDYGRDVYAVPHFPLDPRGEGTNSLLKNGAIPCTCAADIQPERRLAPVPARLFDEAIPTYTQEPPRNLREKVVALLSACPVSLDALARDTEASLPALNVVLLELELAGRLERTAAHSLRLVA